MKCRSEPHVVDIVTRRIASWGLIILGSGTVSTRRSLTPFQQSARITSPPQSVSARAAGWCSVVGIAPVSTRLLKRRSAFSAPPGCEAQKLYSGVTEYPAGRIEAKVQFHF